MDQVAKHKTLLLTITGNLERGGRNHAVGFGYIKFEVSLRQPAGKV